MPDRIDEHVLDRPRWRENAPFWAVHVAAAIGAVAAVGAVNSTTNVTGSLSADRVVLIEGARFNGRIDMDRRTIAAKVAQYKAEHQPQP